MYSCLQTQHLDHNSFSRSVQSILARYALRKSFPVVREPAQTQLQVLNTQTPCTAETSISGLAQTVLSMCGVMDGCLRTATVAKCQVKRPAMAILGRYFAIGGARQANREIMRGLPLRSTRGGEVPIGG